MIPENENYFQELSSKLEALCQKGESGDIAAQARLGWIAEILQRD